ncbi:MAG: MBL fold metallo-hydrolase [Candidatus Hydrogenedentota bacterium]|nr:MAG: MBL fold metallo-hydrolase [Candidatus Hydrogenedentota bacterium]
MIQIADGVFCETAWEGANVGAICTDEGIVLIDSPMLPRDAHTWKQQLAGVSGESIAFLINTDYHFDHMMTDCLLCDRVIAHSLAEPAFVAQDAEVFEQMVNAFFPDIDPESRREVRELRSVPPFITFSETLVLNMGSRRMEIMHVGGHTPATAVIYLPEDGILFTGDTYVHERHPFPGDAHLMEWMEALARIGRMDVAKVVPGHGEVCDLKSVARLRQYFEEIKGRVTDLVRKGSDREEVEERVDMFSYFPVEEGREARTRSFIKLGVGRMFNQLIESAAG